MIIIPGSGDITLGTGIKDSDGKIHLTTMPQRDGKVEPLISETAPGWKEGAVWPTIYGGTLNLRLNGDGTNSFYAATSKGKKTSGVCNFPEKYKYDIYPFLIDGTFTFILLRDVGTLEPFSVFKDLIDNFITFDRQVGTFKIGVFPIVIEIQYIIYPIERDLALQIIGRSAIAEGITPMLVEYPETQQEGASKYFTVTSYDIGANIDFSSWNQARVLSMTSEAWKLYPEEFTVTVKASEFIFLYIHVKQGEFIESGYFYEDPNDEVHDQAGVFGKIELTENRKCTAYLYWCVNPEGPLTYLNYGGFVFCFDKEKENSESFHDVQLEIDNSYLITTTLPDSGYMIHNFQDNEIFNKFLLTNPYDVTVKNGGPTSNFLKSKFAFWDLEFTYALTDPGRFFVVHPREIVIDYDSDLWANNFSIDFQLTDLGSHLNLSYNIDTRELTGTLCSSDGTAITTRVLSDNFSSVLDGQTGNYRNPIVLFYRQSNYRSGNVNQSRMGHYGIAVVTEIPDLYYKLNNLEKPDSLYFYDHFDFTYTGGNYSDTLFSYVRLNVNDALRISVMSMEVGSYDDSTPNVFDDDTSNDNDTNWSDQRGDDNTSNNIIVEPDPSPNPNPDPTPDPDLSHINI